MANKVTPKAVALGKQPREETGPSMTVAVPLTFEEREELRKIFANPAYKKAFTNARLRKPSAFGGDTDGALGGQVAAKKLHLIQGWELFEAALALQVMDPKPRPQPVEETFPPDPFFQSSMPEADKPVPAKPRNPQKP